MIGIALGCLLVLAITVAEFGGPLIPTMGIVVVAAGLYLSSRQTLIVAGAAIATALLLILTQEVDQPWYRLGNVVLASLLGVAVSWALEQRVRSIARLQQTQEKVFAGVPDALVVLDDQGLLLQTNHSLADLVPTAVVGQSLHAQLGHIRRDGTPCPGGCLLDDPATIHAAGDGAVVAGERITRGEHLVPIEYTAARVDSGTSVLSLRDVSQLVAAEADRRALLEAASRQREQEELLRALRPNHEGGFTALPGVAVDVWSTLDGSGAPVGRDLSDVSLLPDGRVLILIVDALGAGVASVRDAWRVLYVSRAYANAGIALPDLVARTAAALAAEDEPPKASLLAAVLDPRDGALEVATGGHPPALLLHENGHTQWLEAMGRGVGAPSPGSRDVVSTRMDLGDSLILYTDGVVAGTRDLIAGLSGLKSAAVALRRRPTDGWSRSLMDAVVPDGAALGDATVLIVRLATDQAEPGLHTSTTR